MRKKQRDRHAPHRLLLVKEVVFARKDARKFLRTISYVWSRLVPRDEYDKSVKGKPSAWST